jgi:hypothetical protein
LDAPKTGTEQEGDTAETDTEAPEEMPKAIRQMQKRIDKITARNKALESELTQLKEGKPSEEANNPPAVTDDGDMAASHPEVAKLDRRLAELRTHLAWVDANESGGPFEFRNKQTGKVETREFTADEVRSMRRNIEMTMMEVNGKRSVLADRVTEELTRQKQQLDANFGKRFGWSEDSEAPEAQLLSEFESKVRASAPGVLRLPGFKTVMAYAVEGILADHRKANAPVTPASKRPIPPRVAVPNPGGKVQPATLDADLAKAEADFRKSPSEETHARLLNARRQARRK